MGRSVSTPIETVAVAYQQVDWEDEIDVELFSESIQDVARKHWPSLEPCDTWLDREDHAILENSHAYIGFSEYCGLVAIWVAPKAEEHYNHGFSDDTALGNLANAWCNRIADKFENVFSGLRKIGTASNGESFFEKVN